MDGTNIISGTSMATPHVTGVGALVKGALGDVSSASVSSTIINTATNGVIIGNPSGAPNRLIFTNGL